MRTVDGEHMIKLVPAAPDPDREVDFPYKIDLEVQCFRLFTKHGFEWGGDWKDRKEYRHFEMPAAQTGEWYPSDK